jgi:hypothetical protein
MTIEATVLLILAVAFMLAFQRPARTFFESSPRLGSRIEYQMASGHDFRPTEDRRSLQWNPAQVSTRETNFEAQ